MIRRLLMNRLRALKASWSGALEAQLAGEVVTA